MSYTPPTKRYGKRTFDVNHTTGGGPYTVPQALTDFNKANVMRCYVVGGSTAGFNSVDDNPRFTSTTQLTIQGNSGTRTLRIEYDEDM